METQEIRSILDKYGFDFKKSLGQNFLTDPGLLRAIVRDAGVTSCDTVLEIGAGAGTLTAKIASVAGKVIAFDVDRALEPVLKETLSEFQNVEVRFEDVMKMSDDELNAISGNDYKVVANIPYYITTPLIMRFLECKIPPRSMTLTVQEEVAERLIAPPGTPEYGALSVTVALRGFAKITRRIPRQLFRPVPKVDSAVIRIDIAEKYPGVDIEKLCRLARAGFGMRRKTLLNNLSALTGAQKSELERAISKAGFDPRVRGESLSAEEYVTLYKSLLSEGAGF